MLFHQEHLQGIRSGVIQLAFRRWTKPAAKENGTQKTAIGIVRITNLVMVDQQDLSDQDARLAGFSDRDALLTSLRDNGGNIYRMMVSYHGEDPRIKLRESNYVDDDQLAAIRKKLDRLDKLSAHGAWTIKILKLIHSHPQRRAGDLAAMAGLEKEWMKLNIRKLKTMGLTISHEVGYEISPRGKSLLERL